MRQALRNPALRRVLAAYLLFNIAEWAIWIALLVWGYGVGGVRGSSAIALVQLVPPPSWRPRRRPCSVGCGGDGRSASATPPRPPAAWRVGVALLADAPVAVVGVAAAGRPSTVTLTRPVHNALLPEISHTTGELTAGNAASGSLEALATFVGPLVSGLLLAVWGAGGVLLDGRAARRCALSSRPGW